MSQHKALPSAIGLEGIVTKPELAESLKVGERTLDRYVAQRKIPYIKLGRLIRFRLADVQKALNKLTVKEVEL